MKNYVYFYDILNDKSFQKDIITEIDKSKDIQQHNTNVKAKMTSWYCQTLPGFNVLSKYILPIVTSISNQKYNDNFTFYIHHMWGMCYEGNDFTLAHDHWPFTWSIVYYIDPPKDGPELFFREINQTVTPQDGMLVIFPGWVVHEVPKKIFIGKRYVVSANLAPIL